MKIFIYLFVGMTILTSCEKEINFDLNSSNPQLVIQGNINDQPGPYIVKLNTTVNFSDPNVYPPVTGALVIITDNFGSVDTLSETSPGIYQTHSIQGIPGHTYMLKVVNNDKVYNAISTMPQKVELDSLSFIPATINDGYEIIPIYTDPTLPANKYRFIQTINNQLDLSYFLRNDNDVNGLVNEVPLFESLLEIKTGDTVKIEMRCVDPDYYQYFYTLSETKGPGGNTVPTNPPNNITTNKALGYFGAYTSQSKTIVIQ